MIWGLQHQSSSVSSVNTNSSIRPQPTACTGELLWRMHGFPWLFFYIYTLSSYQPGTAGPGIRGAFFYHPMWLDANKISCITFSAERSHIVGSSAMVKEQVLLIHRMCVHDYHFKCSVWKQIMWSQCWTANLQSLVHTTNTYTIIHTT